LPRLALDPDGFRINPPTEQPAQVAKSFP
jgi:hypothetical protein